jgi:polysaccharide export outer membrane protein
MTAARLRALALGGVLALALAATAAAETAAPPGDAAPGLGEYRIGPEDVLHIAVWKNDAITRTVPVRPDGMISLPLLNEIRAAGLTPAELRDVLMKQLVEYMPSPEVAVIVTDVKSYKVSVIGEVRRPALLELKSWTTVLDALALAGGFTEFAARNRIVILRRNGKTVQRIPFNYSKVVSGEQQSFTLLPGDVVLVP